MRARGTSSRIGGLFRVNRELNRAHAGLACFRPLDSWYTRPMCVRSSGCVAKELVRDHGVKARRRGRGQQPAQRDGRNGPSRARTRVRAQSFKHLTVICVTRNPIYLNTRPESPERRSLSERHRCQHESPCRRLSALWDKERYVRAKSQAFTGVHTGSKGVTRRYLEVRYLDELRLQITGLELQITPHDSLEAPSDSLVNAC